MEKIALEQERIHGTGCLTDAKRHGIALAHDTCWPTVAIPMARRGPRQIGDRRRADDGSCASVPSSRPSQATTSGSRCFSKPSKQPKHKPSDVQNEEQKAIF